MQDQLLDYLKLNWNSEYAEKLQFSPVPKGNEGDLAMNFFALTKELKKSPVQIGEEVAQALEKCDLIEKTEMAGPYLNLFFSSAAFYESVFATNLNSNLLLNKNIVLEFSGPNTNKPLHLGHMRNHALGIALGNLFEATGAELHRVNIINDKGLALAKSMLAYDRFGEGKTPESEGKKSDHFAGDWYVRYDLESKKNPSLEDELPEIMRQWEAGDPHWCRIWKLLTDWVLQGMYETYERQGISFELASRESEHYEDGREFALKGLKNGVFSQREDGTIFIDLKGEDMGEKVVLRADGTAIYLTQDLSLWPIRKAEFGPKVDEMIHVVGEEQNYYFHTVFKSLEQLGLAEGTEFLHYGYGLVNLPDGRMKSREGTVVDADDLMDELHEIAAVKIRTSQPDMSDKEVYKTAEQIQNAAWKFFLLRTSPNKAITFDKEKSIDFQGATGPYLQYAGVRIKSILNKADFNSASTPDLSPLGEREKPMGVKILEWPGVLERAAEHKNPTYIVTYLLELAQAWSSFYAENHINKAEDGLKQARLALASKTLEVLETGLGILGIEVPEKM